MGVGGRGLGVLYNPTSCRLLICPITYEVSSLGQREEEKKQHSVRWFAIPKAGNNEIASSE